LTYVFVIMSNFESEVLEEKNDPEVVPRKLRDRGLEELAKEAERGMRIIQNEKIRLKPLDKDAIQQARDNVCSIHAEAYGWQPPPLRNDITLGSTVMRQHVKSWINQWDLKRLHPDYTPVIETTDIKIGYNEDVDLERATEEGTED